MKWRPCVYTSRDILQRCQIPEGLLYIGAPVFGIEPVFKLLPFVGIAEMAAGSGKYKLSLFVEGIQHGKIFSFEFIPEHRDRYEKKISLIS